MIAEEIANYVGIYFIINMFIIALCINLPLWVELIGFVYGKIMCKFGKHTYISEVLYKGGCRYCQRCDYKDNIFPEAE